MQPWSIRQAQCAAQKGCTLCWGFTTSRISWAAGTAAVFGCAVRRVLASAVTVTAGLTAMSLAFDQTITRFNGRKRAATA